MLLEVAAVLLENLAFALSIPLARIVFAACS
jgi:hypothetical protein